ncbi:MAG: hypothetical protein P4L11_10060, partial [Geothrix sp.]|nr:hypothetical protein [Geothrix sp.]
MDASRQEASADPRRAFLEKVGSVVFAGLVLGGAKLQAQEAAGTAEEASMPASPFKLSEHADQDVLIRMQAELEQTLKKPLKERRWGMVIDTRKC